MTRCEDHLDLGVFETLPQIPGGPGGEMKCPTCDQNTVDAWKPLWVINDDNSRTHGLRRGPRGLVQVVLDWMHCANGPCEELVVRIHETTHTPAEEATRATTVSWLAAPRHSQRPLNQHVPDPFRTDYQEAAALLDLSPRMSAVLARSILADLLEQYAKLDDFNLSARVDAYRADTKHPSNLRANIHHFREIADFGAHTQKNDQDQIIPVDRDGAEWMLDFLDRLFDYFIVAPEKDRSMRERWDTNLVDAGRKPIDPLPEDGEP